MISNPLFVCGVLAVVFFTCIFVGTGGYRKNDYPE